MNKPKTKKALPVVFIFKAEIGLRPNQIRNVLIELMAFQFNDALGKVQLKARPMAKQWSQVWDQNVLSYFMASMPQDGAVLALNRLLLDTEVVHEHQQNASDFLSYLADSSPEDIPFKMFDVKARAATVSVVCDVMEPLIQEFLEVDGKTAARKEKLREIARIKEAIATLRSAGFPLGDLLTAARKAGFLTIRSS